MTQHYQHQTQEASIQSCGRGKGHTRSGSDCRQEKSAVLISEEDWRAIEETLYLASIPGMRESIKKGLKTPVEKCEEDPGW